MFFMFSFHCANSGQLFAAATALSSALAQGKSHEELARLAAFFTLVGDTLALFALQPGQDCAPPDPVKAPDNL